MIRPRPTLRRAAWGAVVVAFAASAPLDGGVGFALAQNSTSEQSATSSSTTRSKADQAVATVEKASETLTEALASARKDRDVVRVLCLSDKPKQLEVALKSARSRKAALEVASERQDLDRVNHESLVLGVLAERAAELVRESTQCVGAESGFLADAEVKVSVDPNLPNDPWADGIGAEFAPLLPPSIGSAID